MLPHPIYSVDSIYLQAQKIVRLAHGAPAKTTAKASCMRSVDMTHTEDNSYTRARCTGDVRQNAYVVHGKQTLVWSKDRHIHKKVMDKVSLQNKTS